MKIKSLSFDLWNTLFFDHSIMYSRNEARVKYFQDVLVKNGYDHKLDIAGAMQYCWDHFEKMWRDKHKTLNARELLILSCEQLGVEISEKDINNITRYYEDVILDYPPILFEGVSGTIPELAKKYKLGITSDTAYTPGRVLKQLLKLEGILEYFRVLTFSDEIGCSKPDPRAFGCTVKLFGNAPGESLHIGDNEYTDIQGAKNFGMKTILFKGAYEREEAPTAADYRANDWNELRKILLD